MIEAVDEYILNQLRKIKFGGESIPVYGYDWERNYGKAKSPSIAVVKYADYSIVKKYVKPNETYFVPTEEQIDVEVETNLGVTTLTGPRGYDIFPYPIQIELFYQIELISTLKRHISKLIPLLLAVLPPGSQPLINGKHVVIYTDGEPINMDEPENPLFRTIQRYTVADVIIEQKAIQRISSIREFVN